MAMITLAVMVTAVAWLVLRTDISSDRKTPDVKPIPIPVEEQRFTRPRRDEHYRR